MFVIQKYISRLYVINYLLFSCTLIPVVAYYFIVLRYSVNFPVLDDFPAIVGFLNEFIAEPKIYKKIGLILTPHNEHIIMLTKVFSVLSYYMLGEINFQFLLIVGNLGLLLVFITFAKAILGDNYPKIFLLTSAYFLFQLQFLKLIFYTMAAIQAFYGIWFSLLFINFIIKNNRTIGMIVSYLLASLTSAGGIFLPVLGIPALLFKKRNKDALILILVTFIVCILYFSSAYPSEIGGVSFNWKVLLKSPIFFIHLLGASAQYKILTILLGLLLLFSYAYATLKKMYEINMTTYLILSFLLLMLALIAVGRISNYYDHIFHSSLDGRYRIYSNLYLMVVSVSLFDYLSVKHINKYIFVIVIVSIMFNVTSYVKIFDIVEARFHSRLERMNKWCVEQKPIYLEIRESDQKEANKQLLTAIRNKSFSPCK